MKKVTKAKKMTPGQEIAASLREAIAWAKGEEVGARVTRVEVVDVRALRRGMGLSQTAFAARFGFAAASVRNWEQGRRGRRGRRGCC